MKFLDFILDKEAASTKVVKDKILLIAKENNCRPSEITATIYVKNDEGDFRVCLFVNKRHLKDITISELIS